MGRKTKILIGILVIVLLAGSLIWTKEQWTECREAGFSILYCLQHIS